ncbi:MAG: IS3 family transposase [bacterium]
MLVGVSGIAEPNKFIRFLSPDSEVRERKRRRRFTSGYKLRILEKTDMCSKSGEIGKILRGEGLYFSHLSIWRKQRKEGILQGISSKKRGRKEKGINPLSKELESLRKEKVRLEKELKRSFLIIEAQKKNFRDNGNKRGTGIKVESMNLATELSKEIGKKKACEVLKLSRATFYRHYERKKEKKRGIPPLKLDNKEREKVIDTLHSERFCDMSPYEVYAQLLDESVFYCSIRTMYRILENEHGSVKERRRQVLHPNYNKPELIATAPNQVWSWDITKLKSYKKWTYFYLYVIIDIFSRYVVGWMVAYREQTALAKHLIEETCIKQRIAPGQLTIHADRGSSMKSKGVAQLLSDLGVLKTHSRPHVSNDNPYSEAQFKTLKYCPKFPGEFGSIEDSRNFCRFFFDWYGKKHHHSGIGLMTPEQVHYRLADEIYRKRSLVLEKAFNAQPKRFKGKMPIPPALPNAVWINKPKILYNMIDQ